MNANLFATVVLVMHWLIVVGISVRVIMRRPPVGVALAWLSVIFSIPFVGAVIYLLFGEKRLGGERAVRIRQSLESVVAWQKKLSAKYLDSQSEVDWVFQPLAYQAGKARGFVP